ncbi:methylated-DNA--[protein]-cysteine S-methyltransferase [Sphingosinicella sp.]|uniref:methylated-DNA--[protein]-cysteine S-methyltransferase n=1 Tax=Sphingosinicella sp. TaxID=1917971 RepID=UPI004038055F
MTAPNIPLATEMLRFGFGECALGVFLVALSDRGLVALQLGNSRAALLAELETSFPATQFEEVALDDTLAKVRAFLDAPGSRLDLPLDIRGSALERAVWSRLTAVPAGETVTYGQVAKALPIPATAQEVGAACAANVLAVAIPCHRVVKTDGTISGYRWGVRRKRRLLALEAAA